MPAAGLGQPARSLSITVDVEDHGASDAPRRFREALVPLTTMLQERSIRATFFVVGSLAPEWSDELRFLAAEGHEIGLHGLTHRPLVELGQSQFADETRRGRDILAEILGAPPAGYRAPYFSMTPDTPWAPEVLAGCGFAYSSSVLPARNIQFGLPGAPRTAFLWDCGLVELPAPVFGVGPARLPLLGGAYVRLAPGWMVRWAARRAPRIGAWTYVHPHDFDVDEPFARHDGQAWWFAKLFFARRHLMLDRVASLAGADSRPLGEIVSAVDFRAGLFRWQLPESGQVRATT